MRAAALCAALALQALTGAPGAAACARPIPENTMSPERLVDGARDVTVARVESATLLEGTRVRYDFVVLQRLIGPARARFSITASSTPANEEIRSIDHSDAEFWQEGGGRLNATSRCHVAPRFDVGQDYLVFQDQAPTYRSYERILVIPREPISTDRWYTYVAERLRARPQP